MKIRLFVLLIAVTVLTSSSAGAKQSAQAATQAPEKQTDKAPPKSEPSKNASAKNPPRKRVVADLSGFDLLAPGKQPMVVGATRDLPRPVALAPRLAKLYKGSPWFMWDYSGAAKSFVFRLKNAAREEIFHAEVSAPALRYASGKDAPTLEAGKTYFWTVEVASPLGGALVSAPVGFIVVSPAEKGEITLELLASGESDSCQAASARAPIFTKHRLWYETIRTYNDLLNCYPDRADYFEQRGMVYAQLEVTRKLADQDFARADELRAGKKSHD
jgi:hypothetical protein